MWCFESFSGNAICCFQLDITNPLCCINVLERQGSSNWSCQEFNSWSYWIPGYSQEHPDPRDTWGVQAVQSGTRPRGRAYYWIQAQEKLQEKRGGQVVNKRKLKSCEVCGRRVKQIPRHIKSVNKDVEQSKRHVLLFLTHEWAYLKILFFYHQNKITFVTYKLIVTCVQKEEACHC